MPSFHLYQSALHYRHGKDIDLFRRNLHRSGVAVQRLSEICRIEPNCISAAGAVSTPLTQLVPGLLRGR